MSGAVCLVHESGMGAQRLSTSRWGRALPDLECARMKGQQKKLCSNITTNIPLPFCPSAYLLAIPHVRIMIAAAVSLKALPARVSFAQGAKKVSGARCVCRFLVSCLPALEVLCRSAAPAVHVCKRDSLLPYHRYKYTVIHLCGIR